MLLCQAPLLWWPGSFLFSHGGRKTPCNYGRLRNRANNRVTRWGTGLQLFGLFTLKLTNFWPSLLWYSTKLYHQRTTSMETWFWQSTQVTSGLWHLQEFSDMLPYPSTSHRSPGCCLPIVARTEAMNPTPALHDSCQESLNPHYIWETHYSTCYAFCDPFSRPRPRYHDLWVSSEDTSLRQNHLSTWMGDSPV